MGSCFSTAEESLKALGWNRFNCTKRSTAMDDHGRARDELLEGRQQVEDSVTKICEATAFRLRPRTLRIFGSCLIHPARLVDVGHSLCGTAPVVGQEVIDLAILRIPTFPHR